MTAKKLDIAKALRAWRDRCPLTLWRKEHGISRENAASYANISYNTWTHWEQGSSQPNADNMQKLRELTGDAHFPDKWQAWWEEKPRL